jgi:hypothetical protein
VVITINGMDYVIPKRQNASDTCDKDPCWDYDAQGKVQLIGVACSTVSTSASAKVQIYVYPFGRLRPRSRWTPT